jgi:hypothetical protein
MSTGIVQADLTWQNISAGIILHYQDPENFGVALLDWNGTSAAPKYEEFKDGHKITQHLSGNPFTMTAGQTYALKCVITESGGAQTLTFYVDGVSRLSTGRIDDSWSGGAVGLFRASSSTTTTLQWDNFKCGLDQNADGDINDVGTDYLYADYNFDDPGNGTWQTLTHDADPTGKAKDNIGAAGVLARGLRTGALGLPVDGRFVEHNPD